MKINADVLLAQIKKNAESLFKPVFLPVANRVVNVGVLSMAEHSKLKNLSISLKVSLNQKSSLDKIKEKNQFYDECDKIIQSKLRDESFKWDGDSINNLDRLALILNMKSIDSHAQFDFACEKCKNINHKFISKSSFNELNKLVSEKLLHSTEENQATFDLAPNMKLSFKLRVPTHQVMKDFDEMRLMKYINISNQTEQSSYLIYSTMVEQNYLWVSGIEFNNNEFDIENNIIDVLMQMPAIDGLIGKITSMKNGIDEIMTIDTICSQCDHSQRRNLLNIDMII